MTKIYLAMEDELAIVSRRNDHWQINQQLAGLPVYSLAADPRRPGQLYCGTFGQGLWRSQDGGDSWQPAGQGIPYAEVTAVAVGPLEHTPSGGVVWAGTEPSALFRSEDGGQSWQERPSLRDLPSAPTWSFPPRPWTHHVRWIAPDPVVAERLFVGIELGGVMRSLDAGLTWEDRKAGSQYDAHTLRTHAKAPGRVYEAAGGGYAETFDGGATWQSNDDGLDHWYLWGLAVDPGNPETMIVSATHGPLQAHVPDHAEAVIYRRTRSKNWQVVQDGLPGPEGVIAYLLAANETEPGVFYAAANHGLYHSADGGLTWAALNLEWPDRYRRQRPNALIVVDS
jgi:photosystem II stability/assembly factor-like uncharacterized protein